MIVEYHRPTTIEEALALLTRSELETIPLGGGTAIDRHAEQPQAVVDLQALQLTKIQVSGKSLELGACVTLQMLLDGVNQPLPFELPPALRRAIEHEATHNLRQVATLAGTLVAAGGRSPFAAAMLALGASLTLQPGDDKISLGDLLPVRRSALRGRLITSLRIPLNARLAYEYVARTPADQPIVCAALCRWPSGRTRLALGGFGPAPVLAFDGGDSSGLEAAARSAYSQAEDAWASAEYRQEIAGVLAGRCLNDLE